MLHICGQYGHTCICYVFSIISRDLPKHLIIKVYTYSYLMANGEQFLEIPSQVMSFVVCDLKNESKDTGALLEFHSVINNWSSASPCQTTKMSPEAMSLRFAGFHLTLLASRSRSILENVWIYPFEHLI